jgi:exodeoxyribonuclease VII large subunit
VSRGGNPPSQPLWNDLPPAEPEPEREAQEPPRTTDRELSGGEPPDWALPVWDTLGKPAAESGRRPRSPGGGLSQGSGPAEPVSTESPSPAPAVGSATGDFSLRILQVSEVTRAVRDAIRADESLHDAWIEGEVGRVTVSAAGHAYFTLKDERSQLACVFFREQRAGSPFEPRTGLRVVVHGRVDVFETQGVYQVYVSSIQPAGFGDLALRFEALKAQLTAEGLFDSARKRPLPVRPAVIGVATSATGAVWHDICHVLSRRWPLTRVVLSSCRVQGEGAAKSVAAALDRLARWRDVCIEEGHSEDAPVVTILARGGGSLEDLWPFNDEVVVRAVVRHPVPVVCGVGHEVDVTLADFAADVRAPTPSAAAELIVPDRAEVGAGVAELERRARRLVVQALAASRAEAAAEGRALDGLRPAAQLAQARERAGYLLDRGTACVRAIVARGRADESHLAARLKPVGEARVAVARGTLERSWASLTALAPQATLDRGYAIVRRRADGRIARSPDDASVGTGLTIRLARGDVGATVDESPGGSSPAPAGRP